MSDGLDWTEPEFCYGGWTHQLVYRATYLVRETTMTLTEAVKLFLWAVALTVCLW